MKDFQVPVGSAIADFGKHLKAYPRTILSSKFGDGKSYFIQKIKNDPDLSKEYEFLTIYPVNYQVVGNKTMLLGKYQKSQDWMRNSLSLFSLKMLLIRRR